MTEQELNDLEEGARVVAGGLIWVRTHMDEDWWMDIGSAPDSLEEPTGHGVTTAQLAAMNPRLAPPGSLKEMRFLRYAEGAGRPTHTMSRNLNELVMLTEAAISVTNVVRWAQERVAETA